jgi:hypothetical protein
MSTRTFHSWTQNLARFLRDRTDAELQLAPDRVDERWLVDTLISYHKAKGFRERCDYNKFAPVELQTKKPGASRRVDLAFYRTRAGHNQPLARVAEVKMMMNSNRSWGQEILTDIFRVANIREQTTRRTDRIVVVVGRQKCWEQAEEQCPLLRQLCPFDRRCRLLTAGITCTSRKTRLTDPWKNKHTDVIEDYLFPLLPQSIKTELVGYAYCNRFDDENPQEGITARIWRITPDFGNGVPVTTPVLPFAEEIRAEEPATV